MKNQEKAIINRLRSKSQGTHASMSSSTRPNTLRNRRNLVQLSAVVLLVCALGVNAPVVAASTDAPLPLGAGSNADSQDGQHDFDFNIGVWHTRLHRIADPFSSASASFDLEGTVTIRKVWGGRALLEEIEADGPKGHWEGLTLFLYDPRAHQWRQSFISSSTGALDAPLIGSRREGRYELFGQDTFGGKMILVRRAWSDIQPESHHFVESYSNDGGRTWKDTLFGNLTRSKQTVAQDGSAIAEPEHSDPITPEEHQFDFDLGRWSTHSKRLLHPLTGSHTWIEMEGTTVVRKVWGGRANLAEYDANGSGGHVTLLALRWFNPVTHEWNSDFATPQVGILGTPGVGVFRDGRADFYDYEMVGSRNLLVKFSIWKITDNTAQSEQAFSEDGGKTWEVNWINQYTRAPDTRARNK